MYYTKDVILIYKMLGILICYNETLTKNWVQEYYHHNSIYTFIIKDFSKQIYNTPNTTYLIPLSAATIGSIEII